MTLDLPLPVREALTRLEDAGYAAYAVGGCVRDHVLNKTPHDYDICSSARPEEMQKVFANERTIETGLKHGTLTVLLQGMPLEITTFRVDGAYSDGRHPDSVQFTARVEDDLSRRDFTINAMAYSPARGFADPFGGREDCGRGLIRCVGDPAARFGEDALRILRALRFSSKLGFPIHEATDRALRAGKEQLCHVSRERIAVELTGLLQGKDAGKALKAYPDVIAVVLPELTPLMNASKWPLILDTIDKCPNDLYLRWAALLSGCGEKTARDVLKSLKMSVKIMDTVSTLVAWQDTDLTPHTIQEMLMRVGPEKTGLLIDLRLAKRLAEGKEPEEAAMGDAEALKEKLRALLQENACYTLGQLAVNGKDLAALGLSGPALGETLHALLLRVVRNELPNDREALLLAAK